LHCFTILKFKHPLIEHYSAFLDILEYWFPFYRQKRASFISHICLTFNNHRSHRKKPAKTPIKPTRLGFFKNLGLKKTMIWTYL